MRGYERRARARASRRRLYLVGQAVAITGAMMSVAGFLALLVLVDTVPAGTMAGALAAQAIATEIAASLGLMVVGGFLALAGWEQ